MNWIKFSDQKPLSKQLIIICWVDKLHHQYPSIINDTYTVAEWKDLQGIHLPQLDEKQATILWEYYDPTYWMPLPRMR